MREGYYTAAKAEKILRERREITKREKENLYHPNGDPYAARMIKGGKHDKEICDPWLLSDLFSI